MGEKLAKAFVLAKKEGGLPMQMRLAMKSGMSSAKAGSEPDNPDNIRTMKEALKQVTGKDFNL